MKVALTVWEDRISPVFDSAHLLLVAEIKNGKIIKKDYQAFNPEMPSHLVDLLVGLGVNTFICGAVSEVPAMVMSTDQIELIPFVSGNTDKVLDACAKGLPLVPQFSMPGCGCPCPKKKKGKKCEK